MKIRILSAKLLVIIVASAFAWGQQFIQAPRHATNAFNNAGAAVGDFNRDGKLDIAFAAECCLNLVTIELGNGDGTFTEGQSINNGQTAFGIVAGDWNGDGILDLAVAVSYPNAYTTILIGNGDGTFTAGNSYSLTVYPLSIAAGDVNGDGVPDLVTGSGVPLTGHNSYVSVQLGLGGGLFGAPVNYPIMGYHYGIAAGDLNGDGYADVVVATEFVLSGSEIEVYLANSDGTLQSPIKYTGNITENGVVIADFDHDGIPDVASSNYQVEVRIGNGDGTLKPPQTYFGSGLSTALSTADVNQDGNLDLLDAGTQYGAGVVAVLLGKGDGTFQPTSLFGSGFDAAAAAVGDFNRDGHLDVVTPEKSGPNYDVLIGDGTGKFTASREFELQTNPLQTLRPTLVAAGNLDSDNNLDLAVGNESSNPGTIIVVPGKADGTFGRPKDVTTGNDPVSVAIADVNRDDKNDLITANAVDNSVSVLLGKGNGSFQTHVDYASAVDPEFVLAVDVNGDGKVDVITANKLSDSISVFLNDGSGKFSTHTEFAAGTRPVWLATGDFNHDGKLDVISASSTNGTATVLLGNGNGTFSAGVTLTGGKTAYSVSVGDLNGDGKLDVVLPDSRSVRMYVFLGNGDGTFAPPITISTGMDPTIIVLADFNRDGKLDAAVTNFVSGGSSKVNLMFGKGDGTFQPPQSYAVSSSGGAIAADFNHDGAIDLVTCGGQPNIFTVLLNTGK